MDQLFAIDAQARAQKLTQSDRHLLREQKARPLLERIRQTNPSSQAGSILICCRHDRERRG